MYSCTDNWECLQILSQSSTSSEILRDVWAGSALHPLYSRGRFFSSADNLALSLSSDGIPVYKSSPVSIWLVYLMILNLPAHIRMNSENVILCDLWLGPSKPFINLLLKPVAELLHKLSTLGMKVKTSLGHYTIRARLVMGIFDLPAKAAVLCAKQYNGKYGCSVCLHPGKRLANNARVYLPDKVYPQRTHANVAAAASLVERTGSCVHGVFSTLPFMSTPRYSEFYPS